MQWTPETITAIVAAICTAIATIFSKNVVDAAIRFADWWRIGRERRLAQKALDDELNDKGHKYIIRRQDRRITDLEEECEVLRKSETQCRQDFAVIRTQYDALRRRVDYLESERKGRTGKPASDSDPTGL